jgi:hypothetical protein
LFASSPLLWTSRLHQALGLTLCIPGFTSPSLSYLFFFLAICTPAMHTARQTVGRIATRAPLVAMYSHLPPQLRHLVDIYGVRHATTASSSSSSQSCLYPYPSNAHPSPHQIFHLPHGASQKDIKNRYYELVRVHHPDAATARSISPQVAQARFHAISAAYDILRGKLPPPGSHPFSSPYSPYARSMDPFAEEIRRRQATFRRRNAEWARAQSSAGMDNGSRGWDPGRGDDRWKDRIIVTVGIFVCLISFRTSRSYMSISQTC